MLPQIAPLVYSCLVIAMAGSLFMLLDVIYQNNKKWIIPILLFPPLILLYIYSHFEKTRGGAFFFATFFLLNYLAGLLTGYPFVQQSLNLLVTVCFWQFYLIAYLFGKLNIAAILTK